MMHAAELMIDHDEGFYDADDAYDLWRDQQDADAGFTGLDNEALVDK